MFSVEYRDVEVKTSLGDAILNEYKKRKLNVSNNRNMKYSDEIMKFALTMHGYSSKGYNFLRECFEGALPTSITILNRLNKLDSSPGLSSSCIALIKSKVDEKKAKSELIFISIAVDDMSIRKHLWFNGKELIGNVDQGDGKGTELATHAMVIMCTCINGSWKLPLGYFFISDKFSGQGILINILIFKPI